MRVCDACMSALSVAGTNATNVEASQEVWDGGGRGLGFRGNFARITNFALNVDGGLAVKELAKGIGVVGD